MSDPPNSESLPRSELSRSEMGRKGARERARCLSPERRREIAKIASRPPLLSEPKRQQNEGSSRRLLSLISREWNSIQNPVARGCSALRVHYFQAVPGPMLECL